MVYYLQKGMRVMTTAEKKMVIFLIESLIITKRAAQRDDVREYRLPWNWKSKIEEMLNQDFT